MPPTEPTVDAIARILPTRTRTSGGVTLGTFTENTRPTDAQVELYVQDAADEVYGDLGDWDLLHTTVQPKAERAVALLAAANIELAFWPEQTTTRQGTSPYEHLMERFRKAMETAEAAIIEATDDGTSGAGAGLLPRATFPENQGGMIGNGSEW